MVGLSSFRCFEEVRQGVDNMETMGGVLVFFILVGLVMRVIGGRERARYRGFRTPARFLDFTGKRLKVSSRAQ
jgi:hypothetical protein